MKHERQLNPGDAGPAAFTLIEVTIALGIAAFCLLTVFALLPIGLNANNNAAQQTTAAGIATAISADLHGTPVASTATLTSTTSRFGLPIPMAGATNVRHSLYFSQSGALSAGSTLDQVSVTGTNAPSYLYRATVTMNADPVLNGVTNSSSKVFKVWILVTWPALADQNPQTMPANFTGSYEAATVLNCN
jgi:uncharacterized protein (TIGR02598 family)